MKQALTRLLLAAALALVHTASCDTSPSPSGFYHYLGAYIFYLAFWIIPIEGTHLARNFIRSRKVLEDAPTAELDALETNRLDKK